MKGRKKEACRRLKDFAFKHKNIANNSEAILMLIFERDIKCKFGNKKKGACAPFVFYLLITINFLNTTLSPDLILM